MVLQKDEVGWGPNNRFRYPLRGGNGAVWRELASRLPQDKVALRCSVTGIAAQERSVTCGGGTTYDYDRLISTMPLDALLACMDGFPATLPKAGQLKYASTHILGFGMEGSPPEALTTKNWVYFPEPEFLFHRMTVLSNYSPNNVPRPGRQWSLLCEVNEPPERPRDSETVENEVICALRRANFIQEDTRMVARWHRRLEHAYPIPFLGRDELLEGIDPVLRELGIWSRGRFGAWKYEVANQDHCFMQGVEAVDHILAGAEETTYSRS